MASVTLIPVQIVIQKNTQIPFLAALIHTTLYLKWVILNFFQFRCKGASNKQQPFLANTQLKPILSVPVFNQQSEASSCRYGASTSAPALPLIFSKHPPSPPDFKAR